jgi:hypothetical protein
LFTRLNSHAAGRRSGNQFCVYVCDRFVLGQLSEAQIVDISEDRVSLDELIRAFIHSHLSYRLVTLQTSDQAFTLETLIKWT